MCFLFASEMQTKVICVISRPKFLRDWCPFSTFSLSPAVIKLDRSLDRKILTSESLLWKELSAHTE